MWGGLLRSLRSTVPVCLIVHRVLKGVEGAGLNREWRPMGGDCSGVEVVDKGTSVLVLMHRRYDEGCGIFHTRWLVLISFCAVFYPLESDFLPPSHNGRVVKRHTYD